MTDPGVRRAQPQAKSPHLFAFPPVLLLLLCTTQVFAATTRLTGTTLNDAYYAMYNLNFDSAHQLIQQYLTAHPEGTDTPLAYRMSSPNQRQIARLH